MSFYKTYPIEEFYPDLVKMDRVQEVIQEELGEEDCARILKQFSKFIPYSEIEGNYEDLIQYLLSEEPEVVEYLTGYGGNGPFPIIIKNFGPLYWVDAQEFDPVQYFKSHEDARDCALSKYATFLYPENYDDGKEGI